MDNKKEKLENFKTAISSTVRSISNSEKIEVSFGNQTPKSKKNSIKLPELGQINNKLNFDQIRAIADSKSLNFRFSNNKTFKQYEPEGNISKRLYKISEKIRCEKIGTSYFKGVKNNIEKFYQERLSGLDLKSSEDKIVESFENYLRTKFLDFKNDSQIDKKLKLYKKDFFRLKNHLNNKKIYHHIGIYAYTSTALTKYVKLARSKLEVQRNLEQMRALENNLVIKVGLSDSLPIGVDTEKDLLKVSKEMK